MSSGYKLTLLCRRCGQIFGDFLYGHYKNQLHCRALEWTVTFCFCVISSRIGKTQAKCDMEGTSIFVQLGPKHEINLAGAPYELVPGSFVNSLLVLMTDDQ